MSTTLMNRGAVKLGAATVMLALLVSCGATATDLPDAGSPVAHPSVEACSAGHVELVALIESSADVRLECFGGRTIAFRAYVSGMMGAGTCPFSPIPGDGWLNLCSGAQRLLVAEPGDEEALTAFIPPDFAGGAPDFDQWVDVTGHFDDPAAATCDREGPDGPAGDPRQVHACRLAFVLESASPVD